MVSFAADPMTILPWIGLAVCAALASVFAAKLLAPKIGSNALLAQ
jgi:hypothetical protein